MTPVDHRPTGLSPETLIGRVIGGKFRILAALGAGGMGHVYRAEQISLGKAVAVKVLHRELMTDGVLVRRFEREARSISRLNHRNVVNVIDYGCDESTGLLYIVMELLLGSDLQSVIKADHPMAVARAVRLMAQVLSALEEAHGQGVIHRDLKPENIVLCGRRAGEDEMVKVCDFGIAKAGTIEGFDGGQLTVRGLIWGTPEYMSPEQARGEDVDERADIYAAGAVLYHMLTGAVVFSASSPIGVLGRHLSETPPLLRTKRADVPPALEALVARALAKDVRQRPSTARLFREELEASCPVITGEQSRNIGTFTSVPAASSSASLPLRGRGWRPAAVACGFLLGIAAVVALGRFTRWQPTPLPASGVASDLLTPPRPAVAVVASAQVPLVTAAKPTESAPPPDEAPAVATVRPVVVRAPRLRVAQPPVRHARALAEKPAAVASVPPVEAPSPVAEPRPAPRARRDALAEAERLLAEGEVAAACARGEEAREAVPQNPAVHRFLGRCYLRAGDAMKARQRYSNYLELAPGAPDAAFIRSIVK